MKRRRLVCLVLALSFGAAGADFYDVESDLPSAYGYLVVDTVVSRPVTNWRLDKDFVIERVPMERQTILIRLRAGKYHWQEINVPYFNLPHRLDLLDDDRWSFSIQKQKINYAGTLIVDEVRSSDSVDVRFVNRASEIIEIVAIQFPDQERRYGLVYAGKGQDDFLQLMLEPEKSAGTR